MITRRQFLKVSVGAVASYFCFGVKLIAAPKASAGINSSSLNLAVISDIHVRHNNRKFQDRFKNALEFLIENLQPVPDALVINGDLGDGTPEDYATLNRIVQGVLTTNNVSFPLFYTIGNHEFYKAYHDPLTDLWSRHTFPNGDTDSKAIKRFLSFTQREKVYMDTYINGYHLIFLGSEKSAMSDRSIGDKAYLSPEQINWLQEKLKENYIPGKPIFVFLHQPILITSGHKHHFVVQHEELNKILGQYPEVINFSGHLHLELGSKASVIENVYKQYNESSTAYVRDQEYRIVPNKSEGLYAKVIHNEVNVEEIEFLNTHW